MSLGFPSLSDRKLVSCSLRYVLYTPLCFARTLCVQRQLRTHQRYKCETHGGTKIYLKRRPSSIELSFYPPNTPLTLQIDLRSQKHFMANIPRHWKDSTNLEHQFACAQAARIAAALNRVCDTSSGTGNAREKHACMLTFSVEERLQVCGWICHLVPLDRVASARPPPSQLLISAVPLRSARLGSARLAAAPPLWVCTATAGTRTARAPPRDVTAVLYTTFGRMGGKGTLRSAWMSKAQSWEREMFKFAFIICDHVSWCMHVRRDAAQTRLQYVKMYPCNKRGKNNPVEMFLECKVCTEVKRNARRLSNIFGKCQWIRKGGIETQLPFVKTHTRLCLVNM